MNMLNRKLMAGFIASALTGAAHAGDGFRPESFDFTLTLAAAPDLMSRACTSYDVRKFDPPELPGTVSDHSQIDCQGFDFQGKKRLAEFVFRDGQLLQVWVLTDPSEEADFTRQMMARYGEPTHQTKDFMAFADHQIALRKDKAEILLYAPNAAPLFRAWFDAQVGEQSGAASE